MENPLLSIIVLCFLIINVNVYMYIYGLLYPVYPQHLSLVYEFIVLYLHGITHLYECGLINIKKTKNEEYRYKLLIWNRHFVTEIV